LPLIFLSGHAFGDDLLIKISTSFQPVSGNVRLIFLDNDYAVADLPEAELTGLSGIPGGYTILDRHGAGQKYLLFRVESEKDLAALSGTVKIVFSSGNKAIARVDDETIANPELVKYKFRLLPESIPWQKSLDVSAQRLKAQRLRKSTVRSFGVIAQSTITAIISSIGKTELSACIQALQDIGTRYSFSPKCNDAKNYLVQQFESFGLQTSTQSFKNFGRTNYNVIATLPGLASPEKIFLITAHYDSTSGDPYNSAPGADDNASGAAGVLLAAKYMSRRDFACTVKFVCFSGEEQGLVGSQEYVKYLHDNNAQVMGAINLDMIAYAKPEPAKRDLDITANTDSAPLQEFAEWANRNYEAVPVDAHVNNDAWWSDHSSFWAFGYPAIELCEAYDWYSADFNPYYHSAQETIDKLDMDFALANVKAAVCSLCELSGIYAAELITTGPSGWKNVVTKGDILEIQWVNASTEPVTLYYAENLDGEKKKIAEMPATGGPTGTYFWDTRDVLPGKYWIFLQSTAGNWSWSSGQVTILSNDFERLVIYPNPCVNSVTFSGLAPDTTIRIYDLSGSLVYSRRIQGQYSWYWYLVNNSYDKLGSGTYLCVFDGGNGKKTTRKLSITK